MSFEKYLSVKKLKNIRSLPCQDIKIDILVINLTNQILKNVKIQEFVEKQFRFLHSNHGALVDDVLVFSPNTCEKLLEINPNEKIFLSYVLRAPDQNTNFHEFSIDTRVTYDLPEGQELFFNLEASTKIFLVYPILKTDFTLTKMENDVNESEEKKFYVNIHQQSVGKIDPVKIRNELKIDELSSIKDLHYIFKPEIGFRFISDFFDNNRNQVSVITTYWDQIGNQYETVTSL